MPSCLPSPQISLVHLNPKNQTPYEELWLLVYSFYPLPFLQAGQEKELGNLKHLLLGSGYVPVSSFICRGSLYSKTHPPFYN